ncbi:MAG: hypothetical protein ACPHKR_10835, partial [bacterium]
SGILDQDRLSHKIAKAGDNLTLFFRTSERIASPDDGVLAPSLVINDEDGDFLANTILTPQISDDNETLWQAQFQVPVNDINFNDLETDLGFHISVKDPSGNERILEFDHEGTLDDPTGLQTTQEPSIRARIDTKSPEVEFVSLKTSNQGLPDQDRLTHLLAKEGDDLTLYFTTSERIAGVDETSTNTPLKPIVEFKAGTDKVFDAIVSRDTSATESLNDDSLHKGLHWKAVINIDPSTDTNFSDLESDLGFTVKILDPAGNEYSASDTASSMPKPEDDEGQELTARIDTIIPFLSELSISSSNAGAESDPEKTGHLLAMEGDELTLYFKTSERVLGFDETSSKPGLKPEVEFISALTGEDKRFAAVVTRNNTDSDGGLEWKAVLDVN